MAFDRQDVELGMDTYYFEYSDQSNSGYGVCKDVRLEKTGVIFYIKKAALGDISSIKITFGQEIAGREEFERVFHRIFNN
jgi:hypothetical protein